MNPLKIQKKKRMMLTPNNIKIGRKMSRNSGKKQPIDEDNKYMMYCIIGIGFFVVITIITLAIVLNLPSSTSAPVQSKRVRIIPDIRNTTIPLIEDNIDSIEQFHQKMRKARSTKDASSCPAGHVKSSTGECERSFLWPEPFDESMCDMDTQPCNDFYTHVCGAFIKDDRNHGTDSTFQYIYMANRKIMQDIIKNIVDERDPDESKVSSFYHSCIAHRTLQVDETGDDSYTFQALMTLIDNDLNTHNDLPHIMGRLHRYDTILPLELSFELDPLQATRLIPLLQQGGLFDMQDQIHTEKHLRDVRSRLASFPDSKTLATQIIAIEKSLSNAWYTTRADNLIDYVMNGGYKRDLIDNWETLQNEMESAGFNLTAFLLAAVGASDIPPPGSLERIGGASSELAWLWAFNSRPLWCRSLSFMQRFPSIVLSHSISAWKIYLKHAVLFHVVNGAIPHVDPEVHYAYHRSYDSRYGLPWKRPKKFLAAESIDQAPSNEDACIYLTEAYLPVILDNYFLHAHLDEKTRDSVFQVVDRIRETMLKMIEDKELLPYANDAERDIAYEKIRTIHVQVGAPSTWPLDRSTLILDPESFVENVLRVRGYHTDLIAHTYWKHVRSSQPIHPDELFDGLVSMPNAFYQHQLNTITLNAGILQPPVYSPLYDENGKLSRLGVFIAHEMYHSLDKIGQFFDSTGSIRPWLSSLSKSVFQDRLQCFVDLYDTITKLGNQHNGFRTLNENVADVVALNIAYRATFKGEIGVKKERDWYLNYGQLYCEALDSQQERELIRKRTHAVGSLRVNIVVGQHKDFARVWDCADTALPIMLQRRQCNPL